MIAYDLSDDMLGVVANEAKQRKLENIETKQGSVSELPFADGTFDVIVSRYSAHHWSDVQGGARN